MDKKNLTIGVLLLAAAFLIVFLGPKNAPQNPQQPAPAPASAPAPSAPAAPATPGAGAAPSTLTGSGPAPQSSNAAFVGTVREHKDADIVTLQNDYIEARFTNYGGAMRDVAFKKYSAKKNDPAPYVFNQNHFAPIFAFASDAFTGGKLDRTVPYTLVSKTATEVVYRAEYENRIRVTRTYRIVASGAPKEAGDPYRIHHEVTFENLKDEAIPQQYFAFNIGTAEPVNGSSFGPTLSSGYNDGESPHFIEGGSFTTGGFLGFGNRITYRDLPATGPIAWASISNQFFVGILTPSVPGRDMVTSRVGLPAPQGVIDPEIGLTVNMGFDIPALDAKGTAKDKATLAFDYYAGPKEYTRLRQFPKAEEEVMQYGYGWYRKIMLSGMISPLMNWLMNIMHDFVGQWGIAIILMTLLLKIVTLPFTLAASRSAKRMQKIQPEMQAVREKFKDNPQKLNQATMEIWKKHKINPMGGCLPILITMPLFVAFFFMLQSSAELRFQGFLWAGDLSAPDTIWRIPYLNLPLNIMPLLMGATMIFQMRLTPSPSVDNAQAKMMKFMPVFFTFICYNFSCALALYSTVNGLFTIGQQLVVNRMKDPAAAAAPATAGSGNTNRKMKNVTPPRKK